MNKQDISYVISRVKIPFIDIVKGIAIYKADDGGEFRMGISAKRADVKPLSFGSTMKTGDTEISEHNARFEIFYTINLKSSVYKGKTEIGVRYDVSYTPENKITSIKNDVVYMKDATILNKYIVMDLINDGVETMASPVLKHYYELNH